MIIAIDGPAASGKGTLGLKLARHFGYAYLDTGALYRIVGFEMKDESEVNEEKASLKAQQLTGEKVLKLSHSSLIRTEQIGRLASIVSQFPNVRKALLNLQRDFAENPITEDGKHMQGAILDGRDIGTVICPNADIKVFLTASAEKRTERRFKELQKRGLSVTFDEILSDIQSRDARDASRETAPMKPADDAFILDTSDLNPEDVFATVLRFINGKRPSESTDRHEK